jgi:argininosuccinate lyase
LELDKVRMRESAETGLMTATDLADFLTTRGVPFRAAHGLVKEMSELSGGDSERLMELASERLPDHREALESEGKGFLNVEDAVRRRTVEGGTSPESVAEQKEKALATVNGNMSLLQNMRHETSSVDELLS